MKLLTFVNPSDDSLSKIGHDFSNKVDQKLKLSKTDWGTKTLYTSKESWEQSSFRFEIKSLTFVNPSDDSLSKIGHGFSNKEDQKLKLSKKNLM